MQNIRSLTAFLAIGFWVVLFMPTSAFSQGASTVLDSLKPPPFPPCIIVSPGSSTGCASSADVATASNSINQAVSGMSSAVTTSIGILSQAITGNGTVGDLAKTNGDVQKQAVDGGTQSGNAVMAAVEKYKPTYDDCARVTSNTLASNVEVSFRQDAAMLSLADPRQSTSDANIILNGPPGGATAYQQAYSSNVQKAMAAGSNTVSSINDPQNGTFNTDMSQVKYFCQTAKCYNSSLLNMVNGALINSTGDKPPVAASGNPQMSNYFRQRAQWGADRSDARETVFKLLPKMYKSNAYYAQALASFNGDPNAVTILNQEYPNSAKIGLSEYELQEAEFAAMAGSPNESLVQVGQNPEQRQRAAETLQAEAASLQIAKTERDAFDNALSTIKNTPPPKLSAGAISTSAQ